jgi:hypothetical protein
MVNLETRDLINLLSFEAGWSVTPFQLREALAQSPFSVNSTTNTIEVTPHIVS